MAKKKVHIDSLFRDGMSQLQQPLNGTEWDRLYSELHPPKKKGFFWWWILIPITAIGIAITSWMFFNGNTSTLTNQSKAAREIQETQLQRGIITKPVQQTTTSNGEILFAEQKYINSSIGKSIGENPSSSGLISKPSESNNSGTTISSSTTVVGDSVRKNQSPIKLQLRLPGSWYKISPWVPVFGNVLANHFQLSFPKNSVQPTSYIGLSIGGNQLKQKLGSADAEYLRLRNLNENNSLKPQIDFQYGWNFKGLNLMTGAGYSEYGSSLDKKFTYQIYDSIPYIPFPNPLDTQWIKWNYRDTTIQTPGNSPVYRYLSIPLAVGKSFNIGNNYALEIGAQTQFRFLLNSAGTGLGSALQPVNLNANQFNRFALTGGGYVGLRRQINLQYDVAMRVTWSGDFLNMMKGSEYTQRFSATGVSVIVRRKLF
ncbi:MAG: hypothetical protein GC181_00870 [Bacteroidetes bacterium]|nr:hypothetical protein [Bacteroidota bacterium]